MKKLLALLLVLCTLVGLVACGKKEPASTNSSNPTTSSGNSSTEPTAAKRDPQYDVTPETSPYKGKKLQIYGLGTNASYTNYDSFGKGNYIWMMKAAMEEWAAINGVTLEFKGSYNQNAILSAIQSGEKPDLIFQTGYFPEIANIGITSAFTEAERKLIDEITGSVNYTELMKFKNESHGFVFPWTGVSLLYYNKTMFENYGVKSPKEYFMEGTWNWTNFQKCLEEMTKDIDSDGTVDTYGLAYDSIGGIFRGGYEDEKGYLVNRINEQITYDFYDMMYQQVTVKGNILRPAKNQIQTNVTYPMMAMQIGDCEPYNFEHLYQHLPNGDKLEVVAIPFYNGADGNEQFIRWTPSAGSVAVSCDEREATMDMICYLLKVGLKYISDFSLGTVKCDYASMQGKCDLSKKWIEAFAKVCADRAEAIKEIEDYDDQVVAKIQEYINNAIPTSGKKYAGVDGISSYPEMLKLPPASAIAAVKDKYQANLDKYNSTYIAK